MRHGKQNLGQDCADRLIGPREVAGKSGLDPSATAKLDNGGIFPSRILNQRGEATWPESQVDAWTTKFAVRPRVWNPQNSVRSIYMGGSTPVDLAVPKAIQSLAKLLAKKIAYDHATRI